MTTANVWRFYDATTGIVQPHSLMTSDPETVAANTPQGCASTNLGVDHLSQRIDIATGSVIDYQPPAPADDDLRTWAWNSTTRRWVSTATLAALKIANSAPVIAELVILDAKLARPVGEISEAHALGNAAPAAALARLQAINTAKALLRQHLAAIAASTSATELGTIAASPPDTSSP